MSSPAYLIAPEPSEMLQPSVSLLLREAKLEAPRPRRAMVTKPALLHRLCTGRKSALLVTAPAGYGKTSLLAEWERRDRRQFAWVSADAGDDDGCELLLYLAAATSRAGADCRRVFPALAEGRAASSTATLLASCLGTLDEPIVIVIDDAHTLTSDASRKLVVALLDSLHDGSQLVLSGRRSTLFAGDWLASRCDAAELGIADLGFGCEEAGMLLRGAGVELTDAYVEELNRRVEGWPAALYLAGLSLLAQRAEGVRRPEFSGADRLLADYVRLEVLSELSPDELALLRRTAFLDQVSGPLADSILDAEDSGARLQSIAERTGLVFPAGGPCFRVHNVLRELLSSELDRLEPDLVTTLAGRASVFFERRNRTKGGTSFDADRAIRYAGEAGDDGRLISLIDSIEPRPYEKQRLHDYQTSMARLGYEVVLTAHPKVAMLSAWVHALSGDREAAEREALAAEEALRATGSAAPACVEATRAWLCLYGLDQMRTDAERAIRATVASDPWQATGLVALGVAELLAGNLLRADRVLQRAATSAETSAAPDLLAAALTERALASMEADDWAAAEALVRDALDVIRSAELAECVTSVLTYVAKARVAAHAGDVLGSDRELERARPYVPRLSALHWLSGQVRLELGRVDVMLGDYLKASARVAEVEQVLRRSPALGTLAVDCAAVDDDVRAAREPMHGWPASLTAAERRLLPLLATHRTFREIASDLGISRNTVKTQAISVYRKLQVTSRAEAVKAAVELGLLDDPQGRPLATAV